MHHSTYGLEGHSNRCRTLEDDTPSKAQGGRASPGAAPQAGAPMPRMHVRVVSLCAFCVACFCLCALCGQGWLGDVFHPAHPGIALRTAGGVLSLA